MSLAEKIIRHVMELPESDQAEVLTFIEHLRAKVGKQDNRDWSNFSLSSAMRGIEDEQTLYSINDLRESF